MTISQNGFKLEMYQFSANSPVDMTYQHFSRDDRVLLARLLKTKLRRKEVARLLNKDPVSIWREVERGSRNGKYLPSFSAREARARKTHRRKKIENNGRLKKYVLEKLKAYWSPEQIAGRLRRDGIVICHETVYGYILRHPHLKKYLRCQKGRYRRRHGTKRREKQREYDKKRWIGTRPEIINQRQRIGDWEGDTIVGKGQKQRILTHVERLSGYTLAAKLSVTTAALVTQVTTAQFKRLPRKKRLSITYDNGTEFSNHELTGRNTKTTIYFANPYHSWERGTNENTNGLLRQFFPKKSSFDTITEKDVKKAARMLNHRPRKRLMFTTPFEIFHCTSI